MGFYIFFSLNVQKPNFKLSQKIAIFFPVNPVLGGGWARTIYWKATQEKAITHSTITINFYMFHFRIEIFSSFSFLLFYPVDLFHFRPHPAEHTKKFV